MYTINTISDGHLNLMCLFSKVAVPAQVSTPVCKIAKQLKNCESIYFIKSTFINIEFMIHSFLASN